MIKNNNDKWDPNPIEFDEEIQKWFFWDDTWSQKMGYWNTQEEAKAALREYGDFLDTEEIPPNEYGV
jgi:hypothetical protein